MFAIFKTIERANKIIQYATIGDLHRLAQRDDHNRAPSFSWELCATRYSFCLDIMLGYIDDTDTYHTYFVGMPVYTQLPIQFHHQPLYIGLQVSSASRCILYDNIPLDRWVDYLSAFRILRFMKKHKNGVARYHFKTLQEKGTFSRLPLEIEKHIKTFITN